MVLELKVPHGEDLAALSGLLPVFLSYVLSFANVGIYWNNHHHLLHTVKHVTGGILWLNLHLLFWLSLVPFTTGWMGENHFGHTPVALYAFNLLMCAVAYTMLLRAILATHGQSSALAEAVGQDWKGKLSLAAYIAAIPLAYVSGMLAGALILAVSLIWFIPDKRMAKAIGQ